MFNLVEHQHELSLPDGTNGFLFGTEDTGYKTLSRPQVVSGDQRLGDRDRPQEDGRAFGRDYRGAKSYVFEIGVLTDAVSVGTAYPLRSNLDYLDRFESAWNNLLWRQRATSYAMLRSREGGVTSRCYGRPRRYDEAVARLTDYGFTPIAVTFDLVDDQWYSDTLDVADFDIIPASEGGVVAPIVTPVTTTTPEGGSGVLTVGGTRPAWPVVTFHGPVSRPTLTIGDLEIGLDLVLGGNDVVVFDPQPWMRTVLLNGGGSVAGKVTRKTPIMRDCRIYPGTHNVVFTGTDVSGTAWAQVAWRNAKARP